MLVILIVCIIITMVKFINYSNDKFIISDNDKFEISDIYNYKWYKSKIEIYENDVLKHESFNSLEPIYMNFVDNIVTYCNFDTKECNEYTYSYGNGKITINSGDYFLGNGSYDLKFKDSVLELSILQNKTKLIYYFNYSVG